MAAAFLVLQSALVVLAQDRPTTPVPTAASSQSNPQFEDDNPIVLSPEPTDPAERQLRLVRNRLHNEISAASRNPNCPAPLGPPSASRPARNDSCGPILPTLEELPPGVPGKVTFVDLPPMPDLPVKMSHAVVVGAVKRVQTYLSDDRRNIYTEYTVAVEEVLKDESGLSLYSGSTITLDRRGGAVRLPSGRVLRDVVKGNGLPLVSGTRYMLFLYYYAPGTWFRPFKSVELSEGHVVGTPMSQFAGIDQTTFISTVHQAVEDSLRQ